MPGSAGLERMIETTRLRLRPLVLSDAPFVIELLNEPAFVRNIGDRNVRSPADAAAYIAGSPLYLVELKNPLTSLGICGLLQREYLDDPDIGFAFLERHWRKGYAFESAKAVLDLGLNALKLPRILAITAPYNQASINLLTRLGLCFQKMVEVPGRTEESKLFSTP
jgi:[ribosomal protein S5]-alanine N-acetyltransferase